MVSDDIWNTGKNGVIWLTLSKRGGSQAGGLGLHTHDFPAILVAMAKDRGPKIEIPGMGAMQALKFGPGVIGRLAPIPIALAIVILAAIGAVHEHFDLVMWLVGVCVAAMAAFVCAVIWYGHNHPESALLEGAIAVEYKRLENEQAARSSDVVIVGTSRPVANTAPPAIITAGPPHA